MASGHPDWGASGAQALLVPTLDPGDLAVRLGSPVVFDRQGSVIAALAGSAIGPPYWSASGTNARVDWAPFRSPFGDYCPRLFVGADGETCTVSVPLPYLGDQGGAVEAVFASDNIAHGIVYTMILADDGAGGGAHGGVRWNGDTADWERVTTGGAWAAAPTQPQDMTTGKWYSTKVAVDPAGVTYLRGVVDGQRLGVADVATSTPGLTTKQTQAQFLLEGTASEQSHVYLAALIATVNEV